MTAAKVTAMTSLSALVAAPCLSSLALATCGIGAAVAAYLIAGLDARRQWSEDAHYAALADQHARLAADAFDDFPAFYGR